MDSYIDDVEIAQYLPNSGLLDVAIGEIGVLNESTSSSKIGKINWPTGKSPDKWTETDIMQFLKPANVGQLDAQMQIELVQYQMDKNNQDMQQLLQGTGEFDEATERTVYKNGLANHYNYLFNVIRPKLILIKRIKTLLQQKQIYEAYHSGDQDLVQYLVHLIRQAEKDLKKYMKNYQMLMGLKGPSMDKYTILKSLV